MATQRFPSENTGEAGGGERAAGADYFSRVFGESLDSLLDPASWSAGVDLANTYARMEYETRLAVEREREIADTVRAELFPRIAEVARAGPESGVYRARPDQIERVHNGLLLNGNVEGCAGIGMAHETLAMTFMQVGVCMVSYQGDQRSWSQRMFRRDYRSAGGDRIREMLSALDRRRAGDGVSRLARRGILAYAERMFLARSSSARWRMCQGMPAPLEIITGAGLAGSDESGVTYPLMRSGMGILRELILGHRRFVFVPRRGEGRDGELLTIGRALGPLEYAVVDTIGDQIEAAERGRSMDDVRRRMVTEFRGDVGDVVARGVYRASRIGPPQVFYAHRDYVHGAALVAMADSVLQEQRSYPVLLDLARTVCETTFGVDSFAPQLRVAYAEAGEPWGSVFSG